MAKYPGKSAFTGIQTVVNGQQTLKWETATLSMFTTLMVHLIIATYATVAVTDLLPS